MKAFFRFFAVTFPQQTQATSTRTKVLEQRVSKLEEHSFRALPQSHTRFDLAPLVTQKGCQVQRGCPADVNNELSDLQDEIDALTSEIATLQNQLDFGTNSEEEKIVLIVKIIAKQAYLNTLQSLYDGLCLNLEEALVDKALTESTTEQEDVSYIFDPAINDPVRCTELCGVLSYVDDGSGCNAGYKSDFGDCCCFDTSIPFDQIITEPTDGDSYTVPDDIINPG